MIVAVIYVPRCSEFCTLAAACHEHCEAHGYEVAGLVLGDWPQVLAMLTEGLADVAVVADRDHLPPDRRPRVEVAQPRRCRPDPRRPRLLR